MDPEETTQSEATEVIEDVVAEEPAGIETSTAEDSEAPQLEERVAALELRAEEAQAEAAARREEASALRTELVEVLQRYRGLLLARDPDVPEELVRGETVAELEVSYERAVGLVDRLRRRAVEQSARERVPAGAPARRSPDSAGLTPQQKILLGLQGSN
ncbi:MAG: hypothetical protein OXK21_02495 [Chloroflexota bacterium]|nr:hypothetical protein [Chloroflexota bacterium]